MLMAHFADALAAATWRFPLIRAATSRKPVILLYHGVPEVADNGSVALAAFESHIAFITRHFEFVSPEQITTNRGRLKPLQVLLTFDDGFQNQFELAKRVLLKYSVPAIFFVSSRHATPGAFLWFVYLRMLSEHFQEEGFSFRESYFSMRPENRASSISRLTSILLNMKPHPSAMYRAIAQELPDMKGMIDQKLMADRYEGMSADEVAELSREPLFTMGCHTVDHPWLTRCTQDEGIQQIADNKRWLEYVTGSRCTAIAYPSGDYNRQTLEQIRALDFVHGFAVSPKLRSIPHLEMPRIGIYASSQEFLGCKVQWGNVLRKTRIPVG